MKEIKLVERVGVFAENKDVAREIRLSEIIPALDSKEEIVLSFDGIEGATQSFVHALVSDLIRKYGSEVLDSSLFKGCNESVQQIVAMVVEYMQVE